MSWLDHPGSLNWANRKKLNLLIEKLNEKVSFSRKTLNDLIFLVNHYSKELVEFDKDQLTANHIPRFSQLTKSIDNLTSGINKLKEGCQEELNKVNGIQRPQQSPKR